MTQILSEILESNQRYSNNFQDLADLALPPARRFAILTCMDARLDPAKFAGLAEGDAHVIRNAGGRASDDAIRSLILSYKLLGTRDYLRHLPASCQWRFDVLSIYYEQHRSTPTFELFQNAFPVA
jgi:carbonic anhydrase